MTFADRLGFNVVALRKRAGLAQEELGLRAAMHRTAISSIERGGTIPRADSLVRLAGALGCSPNDLLEGLDWQPGEFVRGGYQPFGDSS